jgi:SAM-dependent methyltransferase
MEAEGNVKEMCMNDQDELRQQAHWEELHARYPAHAYRADEMSRFAQVVGTWLGNHLPEGRLLELGCGAGRDCTYLANLGLQAVGLDFSRKALLKAAHVSSGRVMLAQQTLAQGLPFANASFSAVYAHLSVHYFDDDVTSFIFSEVYRVLRLNGYFALRVKSVENEQFGQGQRVGTDMYYDEGHLLRFFRPDFLAALVNQRPWRMVEGWNDEQFEQPRGFLEAVLQKTA